MATFNHPIDSLRFSVIGSVDNGKSTLIGRLLLDSKLLKLDQLEQIKTETSEYNLARVTDGLKEEREQGITIDVAYRFFQSEKRRYIICDCPGHEQFSANMCSGTSQVDAALVIIDTTTEITTQTLRHLLTSALMGAKHLVLCLNKLDLHPNAQEVAHQYEVEIATYLKKLGHILTLESVTYIPISALKGYNIVKRGGLSWYHGPSLSEILATLPASSSNDSSAPVRASVQSIYVASTAGALKRHYQLYIESGTLKVGTELTVLPEGLSVAIHSLATFDRPELESATSGECVSATFTKEIALSRENILVQADKLPFCGHQFGVTLFWFSSVDLHPGEQVILKTRTTQVPCLISELHALIDVRTLTEIPAPAALTQHGIARATLLTSSPMTFDQDSMAPKRLRSMILICPRTHQTLGAAIYGPEDSWVKV